MAGVSTASADLIKMLSWDVTTFGTGHAIPLKQVLAIYRELFPERTPPTEFASGRTGDIRHRLRVIRLCCGKCCNSVRKRSFRQGSRELNADDGYCGTGLTPELSSSVFRNLPTGERREVEKKIFERALAIKSHEPHNPSPLLSGETG